MNLFNNNEEKQASTLGLRIAETRKKKGYTQEDFSDLLGVTPQAVSKWENDISCPDIFALPKISEILDVSIDELLTGKKIDGKANDQNAVSSDIDTDKLKFRLKVLPPNKKPVNIALPFSMVKRVVKIGNGIFGIVGTSAVDNEKLEQIIKLVEEGATGEMLNITAADDTNIIIEIS